MVRVVKPRSSHRRSSPTSRVYLFEYVAERVEPRIRVPVPRAGVHRAGLVEYLDPAPVEPFPSVAEQMDHLVDLRGSQHLSIRRD